MWSNALAPKVPASKSTLKLKKSDIIKHQEFYDAMKYVTDSYWQEIFYNCSRKKFPRGFMYSDRILRFRATETFIQLPERMDEFSHLAIYFFKTHGRIFSPKDIEENKRVDDQKLMDTLVKKTEQWSSVSKAKNRRAAYVRDYVEKFYKDYPKNVRDDLFTQINIGFSTKYLTKDDITFENNMIMKITGFNITANCEIVRVNPTPKYKEKVKKEIPQKNPVHNHLKNWTKYLSSFDKHIASTTKSSFTADVKSGTASYTGDEEESGSDDE